jgi:queuosine precursor transporter
MLKQEKNQFVSPYKCLTFISMVYITIMLAANVLIYKMTTLHGITMTVGSFITPMWFMIGDVVTEVYGYKESKKLIINSLICSLLFTILCFTLVNFPTPKIWPYQVYFNYIIGALPRIFAGSILGLSLGLFLNAYLLSKWKILIKGKYFILRSIGASIIGQLIFTCTTIFFDLFHHNSFTQILEIISVSCVIKLLSLLIFALPCSILVFSLKKIEGIDDFNIMTINPLNIQDASINEI